MFQHMPPYPPTSRKLKESPLNPPKAPQPKISEIQVVSPDSAAAGDDFFRSCVRVPFRSPAQSEFGGDEYHAEDSLVPPLPKHVHAYLDQLGLEAYFVPADGNCLYRALTFGPRWDQHRLARAATAAYLRGLKQDKNDLASLITDDQIEEIRSGKWVIVLWLTIRWELVECRYR